MHQDAFDSGQGECQVSLKSEGHRRVPLSHIGRHGLKDLLSDHQFRVEGSGFLEGVDRETLSSKPVKVFVDVVHWNLRSPGTVAPTVSAPLAACRGR